MWPRNHDLRYGKMRRYHPPNQECERMRERQVDLREGKMNKGLGSTMGIVIGAQGD